MYNANLYNANLSSAKGINKCLCTPLCILEEQIGKIRGYKLVNSKFEGPFNGGIKYAVGKKYEVKNANIDDTKECGAGINLATLDWCIIHYQIGCHVLVAEFNQKDIAAIPIASDGKFRVHRCKIISEKNLEKLGLTITNKGDR